MDFDLVSKEIIGSAIEVHQIIGPGMLESAYEECLTYDLIQKGLKVDRQKPIPVIFIKIGLLINFKVTVLKNGLKRFVL
jgi:hypothetical protein